MCGVRSLVLLYGLKYSACGSIYEWTGLRLFAYMGVFVVCMHLLMYVYHLIIFMCVCIYVFIDAVHFFPHKAVCSVRTYKFMDVLHAYYLLTWMDIRYVCMHLWMYVYYALT